MRLSCFSLTLLAIVLPAKLSLAATTTPLQICFGGGDHPNTSDTQRKVEDEKKFVELLKRGNATSHETYVRWSMIEPDPGKFTFAFQDAILDVDRKAGLKWVPFIVLSPAYTLPSWFYHGAEDVGYVCLEHNQRSDVQSLWNPALRPHIRAAYNAFGTHYKNNMAIESVLIGVSGNYGETLVPASGLDWTQDAHGPYHTHSGWWVGDEYAVADFRKMALARYESLKMLNKDWGTTFPDEKSIAPRLPHNWPNDNARQFQAEWMLDSMTQYADFCMDAARKALPRHNVYLVVGGHAPAHHGLDISAQTKAAAARHCGIRITNEADPITLNLPITRMVASACRFYGTFFSYEPASGISMKGIASRAFNATASGAKCLHWYENNVRESTYSLTIWDQCQPYLRQRTPVIDVAVFYPRRWMNLHNDKELYDMYADFGGLRGATDFDFVDERMLDDWEHGKLQTPKAILVRDDFDDDEVSSRALMQFISRRKSPNLMLYYKQGEPASPEYQRKLAKQLHPNDDYAPGVYFSRFTDGTTLFLSQRDDTVDLAQTHPHMVKASTLLEPYHMLEAK
jgi:hypothetical protein